MSSIYKGEIHSILRSGCKPPRRATLTLNDHTQVEKLICFLNILMTACAGAANHVCKDSWACAAAILFIAAQWLKHCSLSVSIQRLRYCKLTQHIVVSLERSFSVLLLSHSQKTRSVIIYPQTALYMVFKYSLIQILVESSMTIFYY